jgi:hypothetical protein
LLVVEDHVLPGDVSTGDLITLPGSTDILEVRAVRLGQGGFILTVRSVRSVSTPGRGAEHTVTLITETRLLRHGRVPAS